jgi:hypothetical protein
VALQVKVKPPKVAASKLDLRGQALGRPAGGETFVQRTVGTAGGTMTVADAGSDLFGATLTIPAGALPSDVPISMGSAESVEPPSGTDQAAGPAVDLQPSGTTFAMPVQVVLPYDDAQLPADATPADIQVLIVEEDGTSQVVPPLSVDAGAGTVTVETSGFSVCIPVVEKGPPRLGLAPGGDEYWVAQVFASFQPDGNGDSRARAFSIESGEVSFFSNGTFQYGVDEHGFSWSNADLGGGVLDGTPVPSFQSIGGGGTWSYNADGQTLTLATGDPDSPVMRVSEDGCLMIGRSENRSTTDGDALLFLRKPTTPITEADVAGTYRVVGLECEAAGSAGGPADVSLGRFSGTFVFKADGHAKLTLDRRGADFDGSSFRNPLERIVLDGDFYVDAAGSIFFYAPDPEQPEGFLYLDLDVGCGSEAMVGAISTLGPQDLAVVLLVRQSTGRSRSDLDGGWIGVAAEFDPQSYGITPPGVNAPDFNFVVEALTASFDGGSTATLGLDMRQIERDTSATGGVRMADVQDSFPLSVTVASTGSLTLAAPEGGVEGGIAPGGKFAFFTTRVSDATGSFLLGALVKPPPKKN